MICHKCGSEISESALFCHLCGESTTASNGTHGHDQIVLSKTAIYVVMLVLAIMGLSLIGLEIRGPQTVTQVQYVTQIQTMTVSVTSSATMTQTIISQAPLTTLNSGNPPPSGNQQYCGFPFNPYLCNEGPPVTLTGYLTNSSSCVFLYANPGQNYVVWNLPSHYTSGAVQVYGFVYPSWPQTQPFPPYPFQRTNCVGIPVWAVPPYIKNT